MTFNFGLPSFFQFGNGIVDEAGKILKNMNVCKVLICCDLTMVDLGFTEMISNQLNKENIGYIIYDKVLPNPTDNLVDAAGQMAVENKVDAIVAIGGGSVMDCAKAINVIIANGGSISDYEGIGLANKMGVPLILIPTTSGTASEVTGFTVITNTVKHNKMVIGGPFVGGNIALCDPELTANLPKSITALTGMDALTHAIESYVSKVASPITDVIALKAISLIIENLESACNRPSKEARENMMLGSALAGFAFNNAVLGLVHSLAHPLSAHYDIPHGLANAVFLPAVVEYNRDAILQKTIPLADAMGLDVSSNDENEISKLIVDKLNRLSNSIDIPSLRSLNIEGIDFELLAEDAMKEFSTMTNPKQTTKEELTALIESVYNK